MPRSVRRSFGEPPAKVPRPATDVPAIRGKRVVLSDPEYGFVYDYRATSEVLDYDDGQYVRIAHEAQWYAWLAQDEEQRPPLGPRGATTWPAQLVYVE